MDYMWPSLRVRPSGWLFTNYSDQRFVEKKKKKNVDRISG